MRRRPSLLASSSTVGSLLALACIAAGLQGSPLAAASTEPATPDALLSRPGWALRAGVAAYRAEDDARALEILGHVAKRHEIVGDHAELLRLRILARGDDPAAAAEAARAAVARYGKGPLGSRLEEAAGSAHRAAGDEEAARAAWQRAYDLTDRSVDRARLLRSLAESYDRSGMLEAAAERWLEIWKRYPLSPGGDPAEVRLREIEAALGKSDRKGMDYRKRGDSFRSLGHNAQAIVAYEKAIASGDLKPRDQRRAQRSRAQSMFALRRYEEAIPAFEALAPDPSSRVWRARSVARNGDVLGAVEALEKIAGEGWGKTSVYARYLAALLLVDEDESEQPRARRHFEKIAGESAYPRYANPSVWYLGWTSWREGRYEEARKQFALLAARLEKDPIGRLRARYWEARAAEKLADPAAEASFTAIAREFPLTYYGWRAQKRITSFEPVPPKPLEAGRRAVTTGDLARARILLEADLEDEAVRELLRQAGRAKGLADRIEIARLLADAGAYNRAQGMILRPYRTDLARGVVPGQEEAWWLAWPAAFSPEIEELSPADSSVDAAVVSAVMREESGYRPGVTSPAGARGLLQIMPKTGERLARQAGLGGFHPDQLYRPRVNIQLGSFYLDQLTREFSGRLEAAIASYNAGPAAAARWTAEQPGLEDDEWVEAVPYSQTRAYVKRVLRSVHAYRVLY